MKLLHACFFVFFITCFASFIHAQEAIFVPSELTPELLVKNDVRSFLITENEYPNSHSTTPTDSRIYAEVFFDKSGQVTRQIYNSGQQISDFKYDDKGRVVEIIYTDSLRRWIGTSTYSWNAAGQKIKQSWKEVQQPINNYSEEFEYSSTGKIVKDVMFDPAHKRTQEYDYSYDANDSMAFFTYITPSLETTTRLSDRRVVKMVYKTNGEVFLRQRRTTYNSSGLIESTIDSLSPEKRDTQFYFYEGNELIKIVNANGKTIFDKKTMVQETEDWREFTRGNDPPDEINPPVLNTEVIIRSPEFDRKGLVKKIFIPTVGPSVTTHEFSYRFF